MKTLASLYLDYLERVVIGMVLMSLIFILVSGFAYGDKGRLHAFLSILPLGLIVFVEFGRRRVAHDFKGKPFSEIRLFWFLLKEKVAKLSPKKEMLQQTVSGGLVIVVVVLAMGVIWSSFSISANIALQKNQAIAAAMPGIPTTFFNKELVIDVQQIDNGPSPRVTAVIESPGLPSARIEDVGIGYTTTYNGFRIQVRNIDDLTADFFVERLSAETAGPMLR